MEGHDPVAFDGWADAHERAAAEHSRDDRANADSASAGDGAGRDRGAATGEQRAAMRPLFDFEIWMDFAAGAGGDLRVGAESSAQEWGGTLDGRGLADHGWPERDGQIRGPGMDGVPVARVAGGDFAERGQKAEGEADLFRVKAAADDLLRDR